MLWHRFRPRKITSSSGVFEASPSSLYKTIPVGQSVIVRVEIDKLLSGDTDDDIRGFGELGYGAQPAITKIEAIWNQFIDEN